MAGIDIGTSGTLIGAVLESTGFMYQAHILNELAPLANGTITGMFMSAAAFIFVVGCIVGMVQYVFKGKFQFVRWMLIGPTLFFLAIVLRTDVAPSKWKFPNETAGSKDQNKVTKNITYPPGMNGARTAKVSSVFAKYDEMVSKVMYEVSEKIVGSIPDIDRRFLARSEIIFDMMHGRTEDPGAKLLFGNIIMRQCNEYFKAASKAYHHRGSTLQDDQRKAAEAELKKIGQEKIVSFGKGAERAAQFVAEKAALYGNSYFNPTTGEAGKNVKGFLDLLKAGGSSTPGNAESLKNIMLNQNPDKLYSCEQMWQLGYMTIYYYAWQNWHDRLGEEFKEAHGKDHMVDLFVALKIKEPNPSTLPNENGVVTNKPTEIKDQKTLKNLLESNPEEFYGLIARYILKNEINAGNAPGYFLSDHIVDASRETTAFPEANISFSEIERSMLQRSAFAERNKALMYALQLPYYQGVLLFFLSILYPFFALMLLFPGKYQAFVYWFLLWLWAKSWEVGIAMVMLLDQLLFNMMSVGYTPLEMDGLSEAQGSGINNALSDNLFLNLMSLKYTNPTFNLSTYYTIIGTALASIPLISAYLIIGTGEALAGMFSGQMKSYGAESQMSMEKDYGQQASNAELNQMNADKQDLTMNMIGPQIGLGQAGGSGNNAGRTWGQFIAQQVFGAKGNSQQPNNPGNPGNGSSPGSGNTGSGGGNQPNAAGQGAANNNVASNRSLPNASPHQGNMQNIANQAQTFLANDLKAKNKDQFPGNGGNNPTVA